VDRRTVIAGSASLLAKEFFCLEHWRLDRLPTVENRVKITPELAETQLGDLTGLPVYRVINLQS